MKLSRKYSPLLRQIKVPNHARNIIAKRIRPMQIQQAHVIRCLTHLHHLRLPLTLSLSFCPVRESDEVRGEASMDEFARVNSLEAGENLYQVVLDRPTGTTNPGRLEAVREKGSQLEHTVARSSRRESQSCSTSCKDIDGLCSRRMASFGGPENGRVSLTAYTLRRLT